MPASETPQIERAKILITVKTYPQASTKYEETVCTAGLRDGRNWIRIYPVPFRSLETKYKFKKYQWIEADITRDLRDPRPESYKLAGEIKTLNVLDTKHEWEERKNFVLSKIYYNIDTLIYEARNKSCATSLATFKPKKIVDFKIKYQRPKRQPGKKEQHLQCKIEYVPYNFYYTLIDESGRRSTMQIRDWEIYQLYRKLKYCYGTNRKKIEKILRDKYLLDIANKRDLFLFLGTSKIWHIRRSRNPFMIIGVFYPPSLKANGANRFRP